MTSSSGNSTSRIGMIEIDTKRVIRHLRHDLMNDWFPDPLEYGDCLSVDYIEDKLWELQRPGGYQASRRVLRNVPKANGGLRYSLEMNVVDRFVYQALVEQFSDPLDKLLASRVFSHRTEVRDPKKGKYFFKQPVGQWQLFSDAVRARAPEKWVVEADLVNFYESITLKGLKEVILQAIEKSESTLNEKMAMHHAAETLIELLPEWCYAETHGLPQNRDASSFLANQFLRPVDEMMLERKWDYYRYMDDIRIVADSIHDARRALVDLVGFLRQYGLSLNSKKINIHEPGSEGHRKMIEEEDVRLRDIDNMWSSRNSLIIEKSFGYLVDLVHEIVDENETDSRKFRFCVNRLEKLFMADNVAIEVPDLTVLRDMVIRRLVEDAHVADSLCKFLESSGITAEELRRVEAVLLDDDVFLYEWQRYCIVRLLLSCDYRSDALFKAAVESIGPQGIDGGVTKVPCDLAMIIVGKDGGGGWRKKLAEDFYVNCRDSQIWQRASLIAVHELPYGDLVQVSVAQYVEEPLRGMYRRIRNAYKGVYVKKRESYPASHIVDMVSAYV